MKKVIIATLAFAPILAFAQGNFGNVSSLVDSLGTMVSKAIPIVFGILVIVFFWGLVKFIFSSGNEESKADGKKIMLWGLIAMFIAASVWGIVTFARRSLGIGDEATIAVPKITP